MFGVIDTVPIAIGYEITDAQIQTNAIVFLWEGFSSNLTDTLQIPPRGTQHETGKLKSALHRTMDNHPDTPTAVLWSNKVLPIKMVVLIPQL